MKVLTSYVLYPSPDEHININRYACLTKHIISVEIDIVMWPNNEARSVQLMRYLFDTLKLQYTVHEDGFMIRLHKLVYTDGSTALIMPTAYTYKLLY
jgi:hypothetical protein